MSASQNKLSISPDGESFPLPEQADYAAEIMWEITWGGFSGVETEHRSEEVLGAALAMMEAYKKEHPSA